MSQNLDATNRILSEIQREKQIEALAKQIAPLSAEEVAQLNHDGFNTHPSAEARDERRALLHDLGVDCSYLSGQKREDQPQAFEGNIENYIGLAQIPIGLAGPLLVRGANAMGDFYIPMATTEGALVASYNRGMKASRLCGGITSVCLSEGLQRCPFFKFENIGASGLFVKWVMTQLPVFREIVSMASKHAHLIDLKTHMEGNSVILTFEYATGDAAGQNMVTICTHEICRYILSSFDIPPIEWYVESNYAGDKKATAMSFLTVRGKKALSEVVLQRRVIEQVLKTTPEKIAKYWQSATLAVMQSGSIGAQGHVANGLTALFIACGQDVACISESAVGLTRMEINRQGDLYVSVTLPSLNIGTIGGGTSLPTQHECLEMLGCSGVGKVRKFAEICSAVVLAGEISIAAAMSVDQFTKAHEKLGRRP